MCGFWLLACHRLGRCWFSHSEKKSLLENNCRQHQKGEMRLSYAKLLSANVLLNTLKCVCNKNEASSYQKSLKIVEFHRINIYGRLMQCTASLRFIHSTSAKHLQFFTEKWKRNCKWNPGNPVWFLFWGWVETIETIMPSLSSCKYIAAVNARFIVCQIHQQDS